jgi:hypothetical protein
VTEVRFHRDLYRGECVDEATKALAAYAAFECAEESAHWVVRVSAATAERERRVVGELANRALGLTVRKAGA